MNFSIDIIDNVNNNSGTVTVTGVSPYTLITSTKLGGFTKEQKIYNIKGSTNSKGRITVATIKIEATYTVDSSGVKTYTKRFIKSPSLNSKNNIKFILNSIEQSTSSSGHKHATSYLFNVIYYNTSSVVTQDGVSANLVYNDSTIPTRGSGVLNLTQLITGSTILNKSGDRKKITIVGTPKSTDTITIKDDNGNSILNNQNTMITDSDYESCEAHSFTIGSNGMYSFHQDFPSVVSKGTAVNGSMAASGASKIIFDSLTNVKVGDKVILSTAVDDTTSIKVTELDPDGDNVNECTVSPNLTAADNATVRFKRSREYYLNIETSSGLGSGIPTTTPTYTWYQYIDPVLTIKATPGSDFEIKEFNDVAVTLGDGDPHEKEYHGTAIAADGRRISFSYTLDVGSGHTFTSFTTPIFSQDLDSTTYPTRSHWTNSIPSKNGGTDVEIVDITTTAIGAQTLKISGVLYINRFGNKDVTMELNLDNITTNSR